MNDNDPVPEYCAECGFTYDLSTATTAGQRIEEQAADAAAILRSREFDLRSRAAPDTWSVLEYGCHLRDVLLVQRERLLAARRAVRPVCAPMGREERVEHDGYADQNPDDVARQLSDAAKLFANALTRLAPVDWDRTVVYNYPDTHERSLRWLAVHTAHDVQHHLRDIRRQAS
jgi:DinB superfamily